MSVETTDGPTLAAQKDSCKHATTGASMSITKIKILGDIARRPPRPLLPAYSVFYQHPLGGSALRALDRTDLIDTTDQDWDVIPWVCCFNKYHWPGVLYIVKDVATKYLHRKILPETPELFRAECRAKVYQALLEDGVI